MSKKKDDMQNTLDFYNDDMSRKAVGKLFSRENIENVYTDDDETNELVDSYRKKSIRNKTPLTDTFKENEPESTANKYNFYNAKDYTAEDNTEDEYYDSTRTPSLKIPFIISIFIFLILTGGLILKINSTDKQLKTAQKSLEENFDNFNNLTILQAENNELKAQITQLKTELDTLAARSGLEVELKEPLNEKEPLTEVQPTKKENNPTTYVVKASDNLSKISKKFYGSPNDFQRIIDANNLKNDTIIEGQILIIPDRE